MSEGDLYEDLRPIYLNANAELHPTVARWLKTLKDDVEMLKEQVRQSDPSVPEKVWLAHYPESTRATFDGADAHDEVAEGYADSCSGPYRLVPA